MAKRKGEDGTASTSAKKGSNNKDGTTSIKTYTIAEKLKILTTPTITGAQQQH